MAVLFHIVNMRSISGKINTPPWCEKYRPTDFSQIVLEPYNRIMFQNIIATGRFPHLLFYGPPGVGKTTSAENLIRSFQEAHKRKGKENIIHLNASDERGIEVIRNQIYQFVKSQNMFEQGYKFVILDEVDYMTKNAQQALKNLLQNCNENVRFCLICNYICKIEDSLKNEFICIRFNQLPKEDTRTFIQEIVKKEELDVPLECIQKIQNMYHSDIRSMINFLQLHQEDSSWEKHLFDNALWEILHDCILKKDHKMVQEQLNKITQNTNAMDINTCLINYFNYMIKYHPTFVTPSFLNFVETIVHHQNTNKYLVPYFIEHIISHYNTVEYDIYDKCEICTEKKLKRN